MTAKTRVMIVDDNASMAITLAEDLSESGYEATYATSGMEALLKTKHWLPDIALVDLRMEEVDGFDVLTGLLALDPSMPVFIMTAFGAIETAIEAIKRGAYHYLTKPFRRDEVLIYLERAVNERKLRTEHKALKRVAQDRNGFGSMIGRSAAMQALYDQISYTTQSTATVLIRGESGAGKELVARALHFQGPRKDAPFLAVNCTSLPEALLESELFGHAKGSFTGASTARRGLFLEADGGTLFLDEIGDMAPNLQAKILRVLEDGEIRSVGSDSVRRVDVRVIAATNQDLERLIREGKFRADLFYRLNVLPLFVPPLRARVEDIPLLVEHFLAKARNKNPSSKVERFSPELISALVARSWPGNARELENAVERLVIIVQKPVVEASDLQTYSPAVLSGSSPLETAKQKRLTLKELENEYIAWILAECGGNKAKAADILGVDLSTLYRKEKKA
jgi:two-component system response regulator HydG